MTDSKEHVPEKPVSLDAPATSSEHEDTIAVAQDVVQGLLEVLAECHAEKDELELLVVQYKQELQGVRGTRPAQDSTSPSQTELVDVSDLEGILIVDDSQILRLRLKSIVESLDYQVVGMAEDGVAGAQMAVALQPRLIILDHMMPGMSGLDCLRVIRESGVKSRVIICSGNITASLSKSFMRTGANLVMVKPIQLDAFAKAIQEAME